MKQIIRILSTVLVIVFTTLSCSEVISDFEPVIESDALIDSISIKDTLPTENYDSVNIKPKKCIYLTIDDSPLNGSVYIDSIVSKAKIKTNIFMVGNSIDGSGKFKKHYTILKGNAYIEIYNHSYSHANNKYGNYYKNSESVFSDFEKNRTDFDISHKIARLPGRNLWQIGTKTKNYKQSGATSAQILVENGYKVFGWDVEWKYNSKDYSPEQTIDELIEEIEILHSKSRTFVSGHIVLLMHDQMFTKKNDKNDLEALINKLKERDYTFEYLTSYPE